MTEAPLLSVERLVKRFGGILATNDVTLDVRAGEIHALIGPNGAGKSTLVAQICGEFAPTSGRIVFEGQDITRLPTEQRVRAGLTRSFQITSVLPRLTCEDNVALAVQGATGHAFHFWRNARDVEALREPARAALQAVSLGAKMSVRADRLSYGEQRLLEVAMAIAARPRLVLLDEPMAGLSGVESRRIVELLRNLKPAFAMLLIEHDMDAVFALADRVSVLVYGQVVATGSPLEIRANPVVQRAYLGEDDADASIAAGAMP